MRMTCLSVTVGPRSLEHPEGERAEGQAPLPQLPDGGKHYPSRGAVRMTGSGIEAWLPGVQVAPSTHVRLVCPLTRPRFGAGGMMLPCAVPAKVQETPVQVSAYTPTAGTQRVW